MESEEQILARHRKEKKDLQNQITGMKKQATKSKRKQVVAKCTDMEVALKEKHAQELSDWRKFNGESDEGDVEEEDEELTPDKLLEQLSLEQQKKEEELNSHEPQEQQQQQPKKKRNRQKERLAKREAEIARIKEQAASEAAEQPNLRQIEQDALDKVCQINGLKQFDIQPDGHCLFSSILDQLKLRHSKDATYDFPQTYNKSISSCEMDVYALRSLAACYIREHRDDFVPYLFDEATMSLKDIDEYTTTLEETAVWGGEIEILALAKVLKCCISVVMSGRATHKVNIEDAVNPELKLVYYMHSYALGEHYNSLHDAQAD